ncbi:MAG: hypothetical protein EBX40_00945, partial [Gammaproteobacteria bacterium]|nr:hypothetical protein [Gammaproteobacteria bacterium]
MFVENVRKQGLAGNMSINTTEATVEVFFPPTGTMVRMKNGQMEELQVEDIPTKVKDIPEDIVIN